MTVHIICNDLQDVLAEFREIRVPPLNSTINNMTQHVNSFYTKVMEILVQSVVYTFSEGEGALLEEKDTRILIL